MGNSCSGSNTASAPVPIINNNDDKMFLENNGGGAHSYSDDDNDDDSDYASMDRVERQQYITKKIRLIHTRRICRVILSYFTPEEISALGSAVDGYL